MASIVPKDRTVAALGEVWTSLSDLLGGLDEEQWRLPSPLPGWSVQDNVSHIVGTEAMLLGESGPTVEIDRDANPHVRNDIGVFNEQWVESLRAVPPNEVLSKFREVTGARLAALGRMTDDEWNAESFTPAGMDTYGRFMQIRVFDCWLHEQDIRDAVGRPGHETRARRRRRARRDGDGARLRRRQEGGRDRRAVGDLRAHRRGSGRA